MHGEENSTCSSLAHVGHFLKGVLSIITGGLDENEWLTSKVPKELLLWFNLSYFFLDFNEGILFDSLEIQSIPRKLAYDIIP